MKQAIAKRLRELRGSKRQKEIAAALGMKPSAYKNLEYGRNEPSLSILMKLKEYYNLTSIDDLLLNCAKM